MLSPYFVLFNVIICIHSIFCNPVDKSLELVQVLFRHGARTPNDCESKFIPNIDDNWYEPYGYSQLTKKGMMEEYRIGQMLRSRYKDFLPEQYKPEDVYAYSSAYDRTKASLQLVLAALYSPVDGLDWNHDLDWLPVPFNSNPRTLDILMKPRDCPKYIELLQELHDSAELKEELAEYSDVLKKMANIYGKDFALPHMICAYHSVIVQRSLNLTLPSWYNDEDFENVYKVTRIYLDTLSGTPELNKLNGGTMTRKFVENMNFTETSTKHKKIYLYSGHDKTLHAVMKAHNLTLAKFPDFGSAIIVEKFRDSQNKSYIKLILWTGNPKTLTTLKLENCSEICPIEEYLKIVSPALPSDDDMRCLFKNLKPEDIEKILYADYSV